MCLSHRFSGVRQFTSSLYGENLVFLPFASSRVVFIYICIYIYICTVRTHIRPKWKSVNSSGPKCARRALRQWRRARPRVPMRCQPYYVYDNSMLHGPATTLAVQFRSTAFGCRHSSCPLVARSTRCFLPSRPRLVSLRVSKLRDLHRAWWLRGSR